MIGPEWDGWALIATGLDFLIDKYGHANFDREAGVEFRVYGPRPFMVHVAAEQWTCFTDARSLPYSERNAA